MNQNIQVIGIDNFNTYYTPILKKKRAEILKQNQITELYVGDVCDDLLLRETIFRKYNISLVLHLLHMCNLIYTVMLYY